jgi:monoamine oxidase
MRAPLLVGWAGGPKAARLRGLPRAAVVDAALASLRSVFRVDAKRRVESVLVQDWQSDRYARGAYSYVRTGGEGAREALAAAMADTLFFAGEATDPEESGTVAGALQSGIRAAREVLDAT